MLVKDLALSLTLFNISFRLITASLKTPLDWIFIWLKIKYIT